MKKRVLLSLLLVMLAIAMATSFASQTDAQTGWNYRRTITIDPGQVAGTGDLLDFPMLVSITMAGDETWLKDTAGGGHVAQADGGDILFTTTDLDKLGHEIEMYDGETGTLVAWVQIPSLSASAETEIYMFYGNTDAPDQSSPADVWDTGYRMVQHLGETANPHYDSTANSNDCTALNGVAQNAVGQIDGADGFDGKDDAADCGTGQRGWRNQDEGQQRAVIKDGKIYVVGGGNDDVVSFDAFIYIFDLATGQLLQQSPSLGQYDFTASETAPVVEGNIVYAAPTESNIYAWDTISNTILWTTTGLRIWSNRIEFDGSFLYATTVDYQVVKVDASDGTVVDTFALDPDADYENAVPPYLDQANDSLFALGESELYKLSAATFSEEWHRTVGEGCLDVGSGHSRMAPIVVDDVYTGNEPWVIVGCWGNDEFYAYDYDGNLEWNSPIPKGVRAVASYNPNNGYLYIPSQGDEIYVLDVATGVKQFGIDSEDVPDGSGFDRPCTISNNYLIFKTSSGNPSYIYVFDATTGDYITRFALGSNLFLTCFPVAASQGYLVTGGSLINYGSSDLDGGIFAVKAGEGQAIDYYPLYGPHKFGYVEGALTELDMGLNPTSEITLEAWANLNRLLTGSNDHLVCRANTYCLKFAQAVASTPPRFQLYDPDASPVYWQNLDLGTSLSLGQWYYLAGTWDGSTMRFYVNGELEGSRDFGGSIAFTTNSTFIGSYNGIDVPTNQAPDGRIDEVRISDTARSGDWIRTSYNNQSAPGTFYTLGDEAIPTSVRVLSFTATSDAGAVYLAWETASEIDCLGFNLYRSDLPDGNSIEVNEALIQSRGAPGSPTGALYEWIDENVAPATTYYYKLEYVDVYGGSSFEGPVQVTTGSAPGYALYVPLVIKQQP